MQRRAVTTRLCALFLLFSVAAMADIYDTTPSWDGVTSIGPFGFPDTATFGQTFIAPVTDTFLNDFTFYLDVPSGTTLSFKGMVFGWTGSLLGGGGGQATGPTLFQSASITAVGNNIFRPFTVSTGGLQLTPGNPYVALFTVSDTPDYNASTGTAEWGNVPSHLANDGGGGFVFYNTGGDLSPINTSAWDNFSDYGDSAWTADFSVTATTASTPEPSTYFLLIAICLTGILVCAIARRKRLS